MEAVREAWTDERLDDLKDEVRSVRAEMNRRFDKVDERFDKVDKRFESVDRRFDSIHESLHGLHCLIVQVAIGLAGGLFVMLTALIGLVAAQL